MQFTLPVASALCLLLCGCQIVSHQPAPSWRKVAFPLHECTTEKLERAKLALVSGEDLQFDQGWVCVTMPEPDTAIRDVVKERQLVESAAPEILPNSPEKGQQRLEDEAIAFESKGEVELRRIAESAFLNPALSGRPMLGIALAGGGSKASAFGIGVLAGLADSGHLDHADYISSVSGGSYAAYFFYTHRILPLERGGQRVKDVTSKQLFWDCVQLFDASRPQGLADDVLKKLVKRGACRERNLLLEPIVDEPQPNYYQAFLRCQQDVFDPGKCSTELKRGDYFKSIAPQTLAGNIALTPASWLANIVFDWGLNTSQAARTYQRGIGLAYGTTVTKGRALSDAKDRDLLVPCSADAPAADNGYALDCERGPFLVGPDAMTYQELRHGLLTARGTAAPLPFWIINATAPLRRSAWGWWSPAPEDTSNKDMFEMTAMSHGSGRYGYVPTPMSLHRMNVLDSVGASAAFLDSAEIAVTNTLAKGALGATLRLTNFDWGSDVSNYNVSDGQRGFHKLLPIPFYWMDSGIARHLSKDGDTKAMRDRMHGPYIRLIDGGNAENLGVFALMKRKVKTIVIADSGSDTRGVFQDLCAFKYRIRFAPATRPRYLYVPGLNDFHRHCEDLLKHGVKNGYPVQEWPFHVPVLMGCLRSDRPDDPQQPCRGLNKDEDSRLLIAKPAIDVEQAIRRQVLNDDPSIGMPKRTIVTCLLPEEDPVKGAAPLLNCDSLQYLLDRWDVEKGSCQSFPQHATITMTLDSSVILFNAYRELGRQYLRQVGKVLSGLMLDDSQEFDKLAAEQGSAEQRLDDRFRAARCDNERKGPWQSMAEAAGKPASGSIGAR